MIMLDLLQITWFALHDSMTLLLLLFDINCSCASQSFSFSLFKFATYNHDPNRTKTMLQRLKIMLENKLMQ